MIWLSPDSEHFLAQRPSLFYNSKRRPRREWAREFTKWRALTSELSAQKVSGKLRAAQDKVLHLRDRVASSTWAGACRESIRAAGQRLSNWNRLIPQGLPLANLGIDLGSAPRRFGFGAIVAWEWFVERGAVFRCEFDSSAYRSVGPGSAAVQNRSERPTSPFR